MWTLGGDQPVIPGVTFVRCVMALPRGATRSLSPSFDSARAVALAVKLPCAFARPARYPSVLREPWGASVTIWEATAPVKLPPCHGPPPRSGGVRRRFDAGWYPTSHSPGPDEPGSPCPTYPVQRPNPVHDRLQSSSTGSFCPIVGTLHLHRACNFTGPLVETVPKSLRLSCGSELTRLGISLP